MEEEEEEEEKDLFMFNDTIEGPREENTDVVCGGEYLLHIPLSLLECVLSIECVLYYLLHIPLSSLAGHSTH